MKYKIGQKVETPFRVAVIKYYLGGNTAWLSFDENMAEIEFDIKYLKPYKTPHEKLLDMGFAYITDYYDYRLYHNEKTHEEIYIYNNKTYDTNMNITLELSRILTEYLEWLEEQE